MDKFTAEHPSRNTVSDFQLGQLVAAVRQNTEELKKFNARIGQVEKKIIEQKSHNDKQKGFMQGMVVLCTVFSGAAAAFAFMGQ